MVVSLHRVISVTFAFWLAGWAVAAASVANQPDELACPPLDAVTEAMQDLQKQGWRRPWTSAELKSRFGTHPEVNVDERGRVFGYTWKHSVERRGQLVCAEGVYLNSDGEISSISVLRYFPSRDSAVTAGAELVRHLVPGYDSRFGEASTWAEGTSRRWHLIEPLFAPGAERPTHALTVNLDRIGPEWQLGVSLGESR